MTSCSTLARWRNEFNRSLSTLRNKKREGQHINHSNEIMIFKRTISEAMHWYPFPKKQVDINFVVCTSLLILRRAYIPGKFLQLMYLVVQSRNVLRKSINSQIIHSPIVLVLCVQVINQYKWILCQDLLHVHLWKFPFLPLELSLSREDILASCYQSLDVLLLHNNRGHASRRHDMLCS